MKKNELLFLMSLVALTACNGHITNYNNNLPSRLFSVSYNIDAQSKTAQLECDFRYETADILDDDYNVFDKTNLIGGDELVVYYDDENMTDVNHVIVNEAPILKSIEVFNTNVPGEITRIELIADGWLINSINIKYVINADFSVTPLDDIELGSVLYGVYNEFEERNGYNFCRLLYVFSFDPR